jgi:hypothetical protein
MNDQRCQWHAFGRGVCGKFATHGTMLRNGVYYLCTYHAGVARRDDGWRSYVRLLKATPMVGPGG